MSHCAWPCCCAAGSGSTASPGAPRDGPKLRAHGIVPLAGDLDDYTTLRPLAHRALRGPALRAATLGRPRRSAHAKAHRGAGKGADYTAALRLHFHVRRLRRLRGRARGRDARPARADAARAAAGRGRRPAARLGERLRRAAGDPARAGHLCANAAAARPDPPGNAGACGGRRRVHQSHPRRRPRARRRRGDVPRPAESRLQRDRRRADEDGQLVRRRRRRATSCRGRRASRGRRPSSASRPCCCRS